MFEDELGSNSAQTNGIRAKANPRKRNTDGISAEGKLKIRMQYSSKGTRFLKEIAEAAGSDDSEGFLGLIYITRPFFYQRHAASGRLVCREARVA